MATETQPASERGYADITGVGVHNAYVTETFPYLIDALESGASMVELDVWQGFLVGYGYTVSHNPGGGNNCAQATSYAQLRTAPRNGSLVDCLNNIRLWNRHHPDHEPLLLKLELKDGFANNLGNGPDEFDALLNTYLGGALYRPADLIGDYPSLDAAVRARGWPAREELRGKIIVIVERGAFEAQNPFDSYDTDIEYADYLNDLRAAGQLGRAAMFPAINGVGASDPRTGERGGDRAQWFVVFDDAGTKLHGIDTSFYTRGNYLLIMTDVHDIAPAIDGRHPTVDQAHERVELVAGDGASIASSDWTDPAIVGYTTLRPRVPALAG